MNTNTNSNDIGTIDVSMFRSYTDGNIPEAHWSAPNQRNFDVMIENEISFQNIDLVKMAGRKLHAIVLQYTVVVVTDGLLSLDFTDSIPKLDQPKVSGIEVRSISTSTKK
jgi:hypothetical protein